MCSELLRIPLTYNGVPIFGVGVLLLAWLAFGAWGLASTAKAAGWSTALRAHGPTILIVAAAIALFIPRFFSDGVPIRGYGVMVLIGSVAGILLAIYRSQQARLAPEVVMGLAVYLFIGGIVGARMFYVIEYWNYGIREKDDWWWSTLWKVFSFTEGGLVIYGAFFGAMLAFTWYVRRNRLPGLAIADMIAASMLVGLAFGRIGCLLNGCCYGGESTAPWAVTFPRESGPKTVSPPYSDQASTGRFYGFRIAEATEKDSPPVIVRVDKDSPADRAGLKVGDVVVRINDHSFKIAEAAQIIIYEALGKGEPLAIRTADGETKTIEAIKIPERSRPVHPTQIYSSITAALLAWVLWSYYPLRRRDGEVTALMITLYPIARYLEEVIRVDEPSMFGTGLSISQNVSVLLLIVAAGMWVWLRRQPAGQLAFPTAAL
jgi:phosphatidylglycerol---prolipoprotein diacylglyceryl transferase